MSLFTLISCRQVTVSRISECEGKPYLEVDGKPFAIYGAQIRIDILQNCDYFGREEIEEYFAKAKELNLNTVELPHTWRSVEPAMDQYDFSTIDMLLELSVKYDLKAEILWFGSNMIGDSYSYLVPAYVLKEKECRMLRDNDGAPSQWYGYTHVLYFDHPWVIERETKAITELFNHVAKWDRRHGNTHPVIVAQIENEPDGGVRWRMDQQRFSHRDSTLVTKDELWTMTLNSLDAVGQAVQNSDYRVATRTNLIFGAKGGRFPEAPNAGPEDVFALKGIDFLSFDPYMSSMAELKEELYNYSSLDGNYPLIAENRGAFGNTAGLMLYASSLGAGYCIYDLATSRFIESLASKPFHHEGVLECDLSDSPHTPLVRMMLKGLTGASEDIAVTKPEDFAAFNVYQDYPDTVATQRISTTNATIDFSTDDAALAFVLDRKTYFVMYSTGNAHISVSGVELENGNEYDLIPGEMYRIAVKSVND